MGMDNLVTQEDQFWGSNFYTCLIALLSSDSPIHRRGGTKQQQEWGAGMGEILNPTLPAEKTPSAHASVASQPFMAPSAHALMASQTFMASR